MVYNLWRVINEYMLSWTIVSFWANVNIFSLYRIVSKRRYPNALFLAVCVCYFFRRQRPAEPRRRLSAVCRWLASGTTESPQRFIRTRRTSRVIILVNRSALDSCHSGAGDLRSGTRWQGGQPMLLNFLSQSRVEADTSTDVGRRGRSDADAQYTFGASSDFNRKHCPAAATSRCTWLLTWSGHWQQPLLVFRCACSIVVPRVQNALYFWQKVAHFSALYYVNALCFSRF